MTTTDEQVDTATVDAVGRASEALEYVDPTHEQHAARRRPAKERRPIRSVQLPARTLREAASVRPHCSDTRPPVCEVVRFGYERPHVGARREQLPRG